MPQGRPQAGRRRDVATVRALKMHGGVPKDDLGEETSRRSKPAWPISRATSRTSASSACRSSSAINRFTPTPTPRWRWSGLHASGSASRRSMAPLGRGRPARNELARAVVELIEKRSRAAAFKPLYPDEMPLLEKIRTIAKEIYRASRTSSPTPGARTAQGVRGGRLRLTAGLHRQDAVFVSRPIRI
jgi:formate--tetrahydrofolate ligase